MKTLLLILSVFSFCLSAATVDTNRSAALVDVSNSSGWQQKQQALTAVISKKSGLSANNIARKYVIDETFRSAIVRSHFERIPQQSSTGQQWLNVTVNEETLQQMMLAQRIPVWPDRRAKVAVWVVEEYLDQSLVHASQDSNVIYWLNKWLQVMGVPSQFYDANTEDLLDFKPQDVRYLNPDLIDYIHANNDTKFVLLVFVKHTANGYSYRFGLAEPGKPTVIKNLQFLDLSLGMNALSAFVQQHMAEDQRLFAEEFNDNTVAVTINDITDANSMLELYDYLDQHALIDEYQINQLKSKQMNVMMRIKVLPETFVNFVEKEGVLTHQPLGIGRSLLFKWVP